MRSWERRLSTARRARRPAETCVPNPEGEGTARVIGPLKVALVKTGVVFSPEAGVVPEAVQVLRPFKPATPNAASQRQPCM